MSFDCSGHIKDFLHELPKCEHHLHLEGTLQPSLLFKLAERNNITLPDLLPKTVEECDERYNNFANLQDFLDHYYIGMSVLIHEEDFYDLAMAYFEKAHSDQCLHSEVFFDPQGHVERGIDIDNVVGGFNRACQDATTKFGTTNKLIMCLLRHLPASEGLKTIEMTHKYYEQGVIHGLGLDSTEVPNIPSIFTECYQDLKQKFPHIGLTSHAGEEGDFTYIEEALDHLKVTRIDHGVNAVQKDELMEHLAKEEILLTVCPMSNLKLRVVDDIGKLPLRKFLDKKVPFSINSDDPAYFGGYILDNYLAVQKHFGLSVDDWKFIALSSIKHSWCDDVRKQELTDLVHSVISKYDGLL
ncbi:adenine deaminase [Yamadazyma tenuis]|uniref:Adenine deaminase n=1 Tax=Candida tenuis (strain ATCC 10573 / BCRC 21748 / CBS 615 / JCM 9827 / NBRC 10315 / NRRL Y-1498 / VKM Y-70) TaxID=590646 RepID=G3B1B6_CANTC|nr:adenosine deaminase [Yamadazyma tenuis ATCC 10573]XP_006685982.1 uncharacterized protein CANTEDRAFT_113678 [Yamadazyma tenuis ATCC 10573]EGV65175.1 adenosine deaminase [Yamadazyma tenuis ATCC 10573]EGV65176.1 hypothetical protein CANTEDRAFT_113678 [Yamadazyma tenuis ATCC 10573]WEJ97728.1 adenine deaminase [Yamadazyma tenuis]